MTEQELFSIAARHDPEGVKFLLDIFRWSQIADDIVDDGEDLYKEAYWLAMVEIPRNKFYQRYFDFLNPIVAMALQDWFTANDLEKRRELLEVSHILRDSGTQLIQAVAYLTGGADYMRQIAELSRRLAHNESLEEYKEAL